MKKHVVLLGLLAFCFTITAQEKISVIKIDKEKEEEIFQKYYERNNEMLKQEGFSDGALFAKLFKKYLDDNKTEIDNPDVFRDSIKNLNKDVRKLRAENGKLTKDNEKKKSELEKSNKKISELNNSISMLNESILRLEGELKTKTDEIAKSQMNVENAKKELDTLLSLHKKDSVDVVKKENLLKEKENIIKELNDKNISLGKALDSVNKIVCQNENDIDELKEKTNNLFKNVVADFEDVYDKLGDDVFSVDEKTVKAAVEKVESVKSIWPSGYTDKVNKVKKVPKLAGLLTQAKKLMAEPYDEKSVSSLLQSIKNSESCLWTDKQKNQTNDIVISLSNFSKYVSNFEKMIDLINSDLEKSGRREPKEECKRYEMTIKSTFAFVSKGDVKNGYGKYFENLNEQLKSLRKKVLEDENRPNVPEDVLRNLKENVRKKL